MVQRGGGGAERAAFLVQLFGLYVLVTQQFLFDDVPQFQFVNRVMDFPVVLQRRGTHSANCAADRRDAPGAVLGPGLTCPLLCNAKCAVLGRQNCRHPCHDAKAILVVWTIEKTIEILQLQFVDKVSMPLLCTSSMFLGCNL